MSLRPSRSFVFPPLALAVALTGCVAQQGSPEAPHPEDVAYDVELTLDTEELEDQFVPEDDRLVSPPVELEEGAE